MFDTIAVTECLFYTSLHVLAFWKRTGNRKHL